MDRLYPFVPLMPGESVTSFCARLATIHGMPSVFDFLRYLGLRFTRIAVGDPEAIEQLAALTGVAHDDLVHHSIRRQAGSYLRRGETVPQVMVRRGLVHICPRCLMEDIAHSRRPAIASCYGRMVWEFEPIRACARHNVLLEPLSPHRPRRTTYDFARAISQTLPSLAQRAQDARDVSASTAEAYLTDRLGERTLRSPLLDQMPWYAASLACDVVGAVALFGASVHVGGLDAIERHRAADEGFRILDGGKRAVEALLGDLVRNATYSGRGRDGATSIYGRLDYLLSRPTPEAAYEPLRDIVFRHAVRAVPYAPGDVVVGRLVKRRAVHSLVTAAHEVGQHVTRLRRLLITERVIPVDAPEHHAQVLFDAPRAAPILRQIARGLKLRGVTERLETRYAHTLTLTRGGFIKPLTGGNGGQAIYAAADLEDFIASLIDDAVAHPRPERPFMDIPRAAKRAYCTTPDVLRMILRRELRWVGVDPNKTGFHAILVNADEILERVRGPDHDGYTMQTLRVRMRVGQRVVEALVAGDYLPQVMRRNPVNRHPDWIVLPETIDAFERTYVALSELARRWEVHANVIKNDLDRRGVKPAMKRDQVGATFYLRDLLL